MASSALLNLEKPLKLHTEVGMNMNKCEAK